jgi:ABC-2 type transport system permease protein
LSHTWTLTKIRIRLAMRNRMFLFFSLIFPLGFLLFFSMVYGKGQSDNVAYVLGAVLTMTVMGSFWGLSVQLVIFREQGILRRFRLAPIGAGPILASSILSNYFLMLPTVVIEALICRWVFHMQTFGNVPVIFLLITVGSAAFSSFGLIVASVTNTMQETQIINQIIWMAFLFLSGATFPLTAFPVWIQRVALYIPATYLATGLEDATRNLSSNHVDVYEALIALTLGLGVAFEISRRIFRWEPEAKVPRTAKLWVLATLIPFLVFGTYEVTFGKRLEHIQQNLHVLGNRDSQSEKAPQQ